MGKCSSLWRIIMLIMLSLPARILVAADRATLTALFPNQTSAAFRMVTNQSLINNWAGNELAAGKTDESGKLQVQFELAEETQIILFVGPSFYKIWMQPGDALVMKQTPAGLEFSGSTARENEFLYRGSLMLPFNVNHGVEKRFEPFIARAYFDSLETHRWDLFRQILKDKKLSQKFADYCAGQINGFTAFSLSQYVMKFVYIDKAISLKDVPASYYDFWTKFKLLSTEPGSDMYHNALRDYLSFLSLKQNNFDATNQERLTELQLQIADSLLTDRRQTLAIIKSIQIDFIIKYFDFSNLTRTALDHYATQFPRSEATVFLTKQFQAKNKINLSTPSFTLTSKEGKQVSLQDLKGNVVYIDFWGSWCKACISQLPASYALQQKFAGDKFVFVFIDFYDSKEKWLQAINNHKIPGLHLKAEKSDEQYFNEHFGINQGFPRYAVIDKTGKLVTTAAPHPGDERAETFIRELLNP